TSAAVGSFAGPVVVQVVPMMGMPGSKLANPADTTSSPSFKPDTTSVRSLFDSPVLISTSCAVIRPGRLIGSRFIPHFGQVPGLSDLTSVCIRHEYSCAPELTAPPVAFQTCALPSFQVTARVGIVSPSFCPVEILITTY